MWFLDNIVIWLDNIRGHFLDAYFEVSGWVFPFYYLATPIYWLYWSFYQLTFYFSHFNVWVDDTVTKLRTILSIESITSYFSTWINYATSAWKWVSNSFAEVNAIVLTWWSTARLEVQCWIADARLWLQLRLDDFTHLVSDVLSWWDDFKDMIPSISEILLWFADWWAKILSPLTSWWNERLLDIRNLMQSELRDWFPFYDELAGLWNDIKLFFTDPLEWLYDRAEEFFDRFW